MEETNAKSNQLYSSIVNSFDRVIAPLPLPLEFSLLGPDLIECLSIVQLSVFHHVTDRVCITDVPERVLIEHDEIGQLAGFQRPQVLLKANGLGAEKRRAAKRLVWRKSARLQGPQLPV